MNEKRKNLSIALGFIYLFGQLVSTKQNCPPIKTKSQWAGRQGKQLTYQVLPIQYVIIHHTATNECTDIVSCAEAVQNIQNYHMNVLGYDDIGYNFLIGNDGLTYEGVGWGVRGAHTFGYNMNGTGIAFIGNFSNKLPSPVALDALEALLQCGRALGVLTPQYRLLGGLQVSSTKSPGLTLYNKLQELQHWTQTT